MEEKERIDRKEAQARAGKLQVDAKPAAKGITLQDSAFGGFAGLQGDKPDTHAQFKKEKEKTNKIMMNE